jgi:hypothetical protein
MSAKKQKTNNDQITYDKVKKAADNILRVDVTPTLELLQRALSPHKKNDKISVFFEQWKKENITAFEKNDGKNNGPTIEHANNKVVEMERSLALARSIMESTNDGVLVVSNNG